ncbi:MAG: histidine phosphatase family protein [Anaerolineae bacterium]
MVDIYLFRHAHVDYDPPAQITAHNPLTALGHEMAERLAERCDEWHLQYLFVSTMPRAQETADAISGRFPGLPRMEMPEFREVCLDHLVDYPGDLPEADLACWESDHFAHGNERMWKRVEAGWRRMMDVVADEGLQRVAVVSHAGPINVMLRQFLGGGMVRLRTCWFELDWASTSCLRSTSEGKWVRWVNDARHIDALRHRLSSDEDDAS